MHRCEPLVWIEISRGNLLHNFGLFKRLLGDGQELLPVLKADAYGHGLDVVGGVLAAAGQRWFGVHAAEEALRLRAIPAIGDPRILVLSYVPPADVPAVAAAGGRFTVFDLEGVAELQAVAEAQGLTLPVHLKLETGVNRQGFVEDELPVLVERLQRARRLRVEGAHTHYANIEDTTDHSYARGQMERFERALRHLRELGVEPEVVHASCSAAGILFPETYHDLLRVGISLYGHWPSRETRVSARASGRNALDLRPVLALKTRVIQIKRVPAGSLVGYGCTWKTEVDSRLGVLPVGYCDGYGRALGGAHALVRGRRAPVRGRVMMNLTLVDLTHIAEARRGDEVVLIGTQDSETVSAELLAELSGTINYEVLARLGRHLPRVLVD